MEIEIGRGKTYRVVELPDGRKAVKCNCGTLLLTDEIVCLRRTKGIVWTDVENRCFMRNYALGGETICLAGDCPQCGTRTTVKQLPFPITQNPYTEEQAKELFERLGLPFKVHEKGESEDERLGKLFCTTNTWSKRLAKYKGLRLLPAEVCETILEKEHDVRRRRILASEGRDIGVYQSSLD